ncbi:Esterase/lipase [Yoonia tamlensis]|uniref:Esterase/lipase n=1 Tax=Yoonia tamlensis TaxID=390270 RepID=A0A1I6FZR3_9RHOB|nr:alpha/beta fold hydrolase [Yoonia tamlensis]SFR35337.1 Esterase/lipase [Yoonia tamlensis]
MDIATIENDLATAEAQVQGLRPDCEARVVWADKPAVKTPLVILNIHGFSASPAELRPLPDLVAQDLGANILFMRLTGHGQDGAAMAAATYADWTRDVAAAIKQAQIIGDEVILMGCSTGCTLATLALADGAQAKAAVFISPNFGLRSWAAQTLLDMPGAHKWGHFVVGKTRRFTPINDGHSAYWTTSYPTQALYPMADAVRAVRHADLSKIMTPALYVINEDDQVVHPKRARKTMARWGGATTEHIVTPGPGDDENGHVMAGDVFSPNQTVPLAQRICAWLREV